MTSGCRCGASGVPDVFAGRVDRIDIVERIASHPIEGSADAQRIEFAALALGDGARPDPAPVRFAGKGGSITYFHGGGYAFGAPNTHARIGRQLAERTGLNVSLPAYPLAPEHRWPTQLDAAMLAARGEAAPRLLAGDSAGGHLALTTALESARRGEPVEGLILFSPNTDRTGRSTTRERNNSRDPMVDDAVDRALARQCFGDLRDGDRQVSPLLDDLSLLPPLYIEAGADEVLLGDSQLLADGARAADRPVTFHIEPDGLHMMQLWSPWWPIAAASLDRAAAFALAVTTATSTSAANAHGARLDDNGK